MNRSWFFTLSFSQSVGTARDFIILLYQQRGKQLSHQATGQHSLLWILFSTKSMSFAVYSIRFLYKDKTTHSGPLCKMALILLGERRVLQTNIMDDNQLCNPLCTNLFWHGGMSKYNKTAFFIKEEVINLMICSPCVLFTAALPHYTTLLSPFSAC